MKKFVHLFGLLTFAVTVAIVFSFCDQPEIKADISDPHDQSVSVRTDCEDCDDNCCCAITLDDDTSVTLQLCGTANGASACVDNGPLDCQLTSLSGGGQFVVLTSATVIRHVFCMNEFETLRIYNPSSTDGADFTITCQFDSGLPQTLNVHLDAIQTRWFDVIDGCVVEQCN